MKISYRVENLRAIEGCDWIDLKPLTILVGKNSAGKSTFLRSLALLRQSVETRASAPVLWYGERTDFGNYKSAVRNKDEDSSIAFGVKVENLKYSTVPDSDFKYFSRHLIKNMSVDGVELTVRLQSSGRKTSYKEIHMKTQGSDQDIRFLFSSNKVLAPEIIVGGEKSEGDLP